MKQHLITCIIYCESKLIDDVSCNGVHTSTTSSCVPFAFKTSVRIMRLVSIRPKCGSTARFKIMNLNQQSSRSQRRTHGVTLIIIINNKLLMSFLYKLNTRLWHIQSPLLKPLASQSEFLRIPQPRDLICATSWSISHDLHRLQIGQGTAMTQ